MDAVEGALECRLEPKSSRRMKANVAHPHYSLESSLGGCHACLDLGD